MIIDISNIETTKLGFCAERRKEASAKVRKAKQILKNESIEDLQKARIKNAISNAEGAIEHGNKHTLEVAIGRLEYQLKRQEAM